MIQTGERTLIVRDIEEAIREQGDEPLNDWEGAKRIVISN